MALLTIEGFETRAEKAGWVFTGGSYAAGRFGGYGIVGTGTGNSCVFSTPAGITTAVAGAAFMSTNLNNMPDTNGGMFFIRDTGGITHLCLNATNTGYLTLRRGTPTGTLLASATTNPMITNVWHYIEVKATIADAGGRAIVRIDGNTVIDFTGDTQNGGVTQIGQVAVKPFSFAGGTVAIDDVYICDTTGAAPYNDFMGDVKVETIVPTGNGNASQLVGSDGNSIDNYLLVDELPVSLTDYVGSSTIGQKDTYGFSNLSTVSGQVFAVQASALAFKSDAGTANMKVVERVSTGTERDTADFGLVASPGAWITTGPRITDPDGAAWTLASVNSAEFGTKVG